MKDQIFTTMVIPGPVKSGKQQVSIGFDLNLLHEVFNDPSTDPSKWKADVLLFTKIIRIACDKNLFSLNFNNGSVDLPILFKKPTNDASAYRLWAGMLGYKLKGTNAFMREKDWIGQDSPLELNKLDKNKFTLASFQGNSLLGFPTKTPARKDSITDVKDIAQRLKDNSILSQIMGNGMTKQLVEGIGIAHQAAIQRERDRNMAILELAKKQVKTTDHPILSELLAVDKSATWITDPGTQAQLDELVEFYKAAQFVINERDYIREAIDKLNANLKVREYLGTMIHGTVDIPANNTTTFILKINEKILVDEIIASGDSIKYPEYFSCERGTNVTSSLLPGIPNLLAASVPDREYASYYTNTVVLLAKKSAVISWETESAKQNLNLANMHLNENQQLRDAVFDPVMYESLKSFVTPSLSQLEDLQAKVINKHKLIKAAAKANNQISNVQTKGHQIYITDVEWLQFDPSRRRPKDNPHFFEHDLIAGFNTYVKVDKKIYCLNKVNEYFGPWVNPDEFRDKHLEEAYHPIGTDSMVHAAIAPVAGVPENTPNNSIQGIHTGFQFLWDGTNVSNRNPMRHQEVGSVSEANKAADLIADFTKHRHDMAIESLVLQLYSRRLMMIMHYPFPQKKKTQNSEHLLARGFIFKDANAPRPLLKFTTKAKYQYALAGQYHNGYCPADPEILDKMPNAFTEPQSFLRYDHIKAPIVALPFPIYEDAKHKTLKKQYLGESNVDLVIRKATMLDFDYVECERYILPPQIPNFPIFLWYDMDKDDPFTKSRRLSDDEVLKWYKLSQTESIDGNEIEGSNGHAIYNGSIQYLPDPAITGFIIRFFYDRDCTINFDENLYQEKFCSYSDLTYPQLGAWKIILRELRGSLKYVDIDEVTKTLYVSMQPGQQIFAEICSAFDPGFACFADPIIEGPDFVSKKPQEYYYDLLKCGVQKLSFTYACQYPLIIPRINSINLSRFQTGTVGKIPSSTTVNMKIQYEHLNLWNGITIPDEQPTGELDLYMLWDDYSLDKSGIQKSITDKIKIGKEGDNYIHVGSVVFAHKTNQGTVYHHNLKTLGDKKMHAENAEMQEAIVSFEMDSLFNIAYFTDAVFRVRNVSKFVGYFHRTDLTKIGKASKQDFSIWSEPFYLEHPIEKGSQIYYPKSDNAEACYLFNNQKPTTPVIEKIVPLIVRDDFKQKVAFYQRIRIYFSQIALTGKQNRIGIFVCKSSSKKPPEPCSVYMNFLKGNISTAGKDIVTDQIGNPFVDDNQLTNLNFNIDPTLLEPIYMENFRPAYDYPEGLVNYIICYDDEQSLWYADMEIELGERGKEQFHNKFVQLFMASYQPFSANYNGAVNPFEDSDVGFAKDYRMSSPVKAEFFSIFPSREFAHPMILFKRHPKSWCTLSGSTASLFINRSDSQKLHTDFIISVQRRIAHDMWEDYKIESLTVQFRLDGKTTQTSEQTDPNGKAYMSLFHDFIDPLINAKYFECDFKIHFTKNIIHNYRVVIEEIDLYNGLIIDALQKVLNSTENPRLMTINGVAIRGTYIFD